MTVEITSSQTKDTPRETWTAMLRGWRLRCPSCGTGKLYRAYLKVADSCPSCREQLHHHRADDAPAYFTMFIVGHIVVAGVLAVEDIYAPSYWVHLAIWFPMLLILSLWLLPRIKGTIVALQWAARMHGFGDETDDDHDAGSIEATRPR